MGYRIGPHVNLTNDTMTYRLTFQAFQTFYFHFVTKLDISGIMEKFWNFPKISDGYIGILGKSFIFGWMSYSSTKTILYLFIYRNSIWLSPPILFKVYREVILWKQQISVKNVSWLLIFMCHWKSLLRGTSVWQLEILIIRQTYFLENI